MKIFGHGPRAGWDCKRHRLTFRWAVQRELDFVGTVYGVDRGTSMDELMRRQSEFYGAYRNDQILQD